MSAPLSSIALKPLKLVSMPFFISSYRARCSPLSVSGAISGSRILYLLAPIFVHCFAQGAVPTDHGIWSDSCQCIIHLGKQPADTSQCQPANRRKSKSLGIGTPHHQNLRLEMARDRGR